MLNVWKAATKCSFSILAKMRANDGSKWVYTVNGTRKICQATYLIQNLKLWNMHLNSLKRQLLLCFTVITPHLLSELYWVTDGFSYGSTAQVLVIKITHLHMIYTPHFHLFWAFIRHLSIICQSKTKKEWGFPRVIRCYLWFKSNNIRKVLFPIGIH